MDDIQKRLIAEVADLHSVPEGAYSLRANGESVEMHSSANIVIEKKTDKPGIDIYVADGTKNESMHIPVIISQTGITELVYNDFHIGKDCNVTIIAGCGIHNCGDQRSEHDGIHTFYVGERSIVRYVEKHYGEGDGNGERILNPTTVINLEKDSTLEMDSVQIKGVDSTLRTTKAVIGDGATLIIKEKIMTHGKQHAETDFSVDLNGEGSSTRLVSRSVARDSSTQLFRSNINGNNRCHGHSECDGIIMDNGKVAAIPEINANHVDATLIHEAAIGKIAGEQLTKLMSLGLTETEAENMIINGFLK
ncbi:MAG: SufD family Fe-S cluster assembly protein [Lachnospiraceae bacterium]|nr:SufD family Fe-S cluster assembly protein [Lachnospiraceae bacterium]